MNTAVLTAVAQVLVLLAALAAVHAPLGAYLARTYTSPQHLRIERLWYRAVRVDPDAEQRWTTYLMSLLGFSLVSVLFLYGMLRLQAYLPWSLGFSGFDPAGAWNSAVSFTTNTNWQWYSGEAAAGQLVQMAGFAVQNVVSAAVGLAVTIALVRGFARSGNDARIGNFWSGLTRGVLQNLDPHTAVSTVEGATQHVLDGPVASQEAIKDLGTNGGGFFNANSAHPLENPTPFTNIVEIFLLLVIPFTLPRAFGIMVGDKRQGWAILGLMAGLWAVSLALTTCAIVDFACGVDATMIVVGVSRHSVWRQALLGSSGVEIARLSGAIDVHLVTHDRRAPVRVSGHGIRRCPRHVVSRGG